MFIFHKEKGQVNIISYSDNLNVQGGLTGIWSYQEVVFNEVLFIIKIIINK